MTLCYTDVHNNVSKTFDDPKENTRIINISSPDSQE